MGFRWPVPTSLCAKRLGGRITAMNTFGGNEDRKLPPGSVAATVDQVRFAEVRVGSSALWMVIDRFGVPWLVLALRGR